MTYRMSGFVLYYLHSSDYLHSLFCMMEYFAFVRILYINLYLFQMIEYFVFQVHSS
jgi:hypothetical protein